MEIDSSLYNDLIKKLNIFISDPFENYQIAYSIQLTLVEEIIKIETLIKINRKIINKNKSITKDKNTTMEIRRTLGLETKHLRDIEKHLKEDLKLLRGIGDSIAFSYFKKYNLKPLCAKQSAGFISGKKGLKKELDELRKIFLKGKFAILNDLTNSLRYGDITTVHEGKPYILEIKSSNMKNARIYRQLKGIEENIKLIQKQQ